MTPADRELLLDLVDWCRDFFDDPEGQWGRDAAEVLASNIAYTSDERERRQAELAAEISKEQQNGKG
jgi:hypothetical protein